MMADLTLQQWHEQQFLPWKRAVAQYLDEKQQQEARLHENIGQLQTIVALLLDGRTRPALLAWNTLQLHPKLSDIRVGQDGQTLSLVQAGGKVTIMRLDDIIDDLQRMLDERAANPQPQAGKVRQASDRPGGR